MMPGQKQSLTTDQFKILTSLLLPASNLRTNLIDLFPYPIRQSTASVTTSSFRQFRKLLDKPKNIIPECVYLVKCYFMDFLAKLFGEKGQGLL